MNSELPLYEQIKTVIDRRIETEEWPANFQVPSEGDLAGEFGASRLTVRRALRELQADGLLVRIQGRGTFVIGPRMQCAIFSLPDITEEISFSGGAHTCRVLQHAILGKDSPGRNMLQLPPEDVVFFSRLIHLEDGTPIQLEDRYVNGAEAPGYIEQDFTNVTPHNWLLRETTVTTIVNSTVGAKSSHSVVVTALDRAGNSGSSAALSFTISDTLFTSGFESPSGLASACRIASSGSFSAASGSGP